MIVARVRRRLRGGGHKAHVSKCVSEWLVTAWYTHMTSFISYDAI